MKLISKNKKGVSLIEYGLLLGLIVVFSIALVSGLGGNLNDYFSRYGSIFGSYMASAQPPGEKDPSAITMEIDTALATGTTYSVALKNASGVVIDWGAGDANGSCQTSFSGTVVASCAYPTPGTYTVSIEGSLSGIGKYATLSGIDMLTAVKSWGYAPITDLDYVFFKASNLVDVPDQLPIGVTTLEGAFWSATSFNDADVSGWDVSAVTTFSKMFYSTSFNQDVSSWDVGSATALNSLFKVNTAFNQDISGWNTSSVTNMAEIFHGASSFNQDISGWDVSNVTNFNDTFRSAVAFDQDISGWVIGTGVSMKRMFRAANSFTADLGSWNMTGVAAIGAIFADSGYNQDISGWDVSSVTDMSDAFLRNSVFNQDISGWDVSSVLNMEGMFEDSESFNQDLSGWCVVNFSSAPSNFDNNAISWVQPRPSWGNCP
jgi:surface protein